MKVIVQRPALRELDAIFDWIARDNPAAARRVISRIRSRINRLAASGLPRSCRVGLIDGTHELVDAPYVVIYAVDDANDAIIVLSVVHNARDRRGGG